jgi:uncharacterized protein YpmB
MKKWIILIACFIFIVVTWQAISIYHTAMGPVKEDKEQAVESAKQAAGLQTINEVYSYNGTTPYVIIQGVNSENEEMVVWVDENGEIAHSALAEEGIKREDVLQYLNTERDPSEIISVTLAMEKNIPLWEIKFKDQNNQYNLYYIKFENGEYFQRIIF